MHAESSEVRCIPHTHEYIDRTSNSFLRERQELEEEGLVGILPVLELSRDASWEVIPP